MPFRGTAAEREELRERLATLPLGEVDTLTLVDNTPEAAEPPDGPVTVIRAAALATPAYARNRGAERGEAPWLVFFDADVTPAPDLLERYFDPPPAERTGLLAGGVADEPVPPDGPAVARYAHVRGFMTQDDTLRHPEWGFPKTANAAVRREAFEAVGGFRDEIRAAEDADLTFRLRAAGWQMERREGAMAVHRSRRSLGGFVRQKLTHGSGGAWLEREHPGSSVPRRLPGLAWWGVRSAARRLARSPGDRDERLWAVLEPLELIVHELGRPLPNERAGPPLTPGPARLGPGSVCAVAPHPIPTQTRAPDETRIASTIPGALAAGTEWLWLLDRGVEPAPDALEQLLAGLERCPEEPLLLGGQVTGRDGRPDPGSLPVPEVFHPERAVEAFSQRLLSLRVAPPGSLLVRRAVFERFGVPRQANRLEWSARVLSTGPGFLVPQSTAVRAEAPPPSGWLGLVRGDALEPRERPWFAFRAAEQALARLRA